MAIYKLPEVLTDWEKLGAYLPAGTSRNRLFTVRIGTGDASPERTLLILHGFPESSYSFHKVIKPLSEFFEQIVLFDFPGFGLSDKPSDYSYSLFEQADAALEVWKAMNISGGHLLAHDMGDSVATELIARNERGVLPGWLSKGFHSATFTNGNMVMEKGNLRITQSILRIPYAGALLARFSSYPLFRHQVRSASGAEHLPEREIELMWEAIHHKGGKRLMHRLIGYLDERDRFQNTRWLPALEQTSIPIHLCWGERDRVAPVAVARHLKEHVCQDAVLTLMPDTGHFCQLEQPDTWCDSVIRFIQ